ncbi:MAG: PaaI family thioesterase [Myxococcales bacterium]|nr:PaaI family thioesterase [Myxococcales bacterium]
MTTQRDPEKLKRKLFEFAQDFPFFKLIGFELIDFGPKWCKAKIELRDDLRNANGVMHGGAIATLIDAAITQCMLTTDEYQQIRDTRGSMTSVDLRIKYLRPLGEGSATCEAEIPHLGRRIGHASAVVKNDAGKVIATGDSIIMLTLGNAGK